MRAEFEVEAEYIELGRLGCRPVIHGITSIIQNVWFALSIKNGCFINVTRQAFRSIEVDVRLAGRIIDERQGMAQEFGLSTESLC